MIEERTAVARVIADFVNQFGKDITAELLTTYLTDAEGVATSLGDAIAAGDTKTVASIAHRIKGSVGNFDAARAMALADRLQHSAKAGAAKNVLRAQCDELLGELAAVRTTLLNERAALLS